MNKKILKSTRLSALAVAALATTVVAAESYSPHRFQQNDWFAEFGENTSQYVNPGILTEVDQLEGSLGAYRTINYQAGQQYLNVAAPIGYDQTVALTYFNNGATLDNGLGYNENAIMMGYAIRAIHHLSFGVNANLLNINQFDIKNHWTLGLDLGVVWNPISNSKFGHLLLGFAIQNALQPVVPTQEGSDGFALQGAENTYAIPMNLNTSAFWRGLDKRLELKVEASIIDLTKPVEEGGLEDPLQRVAFGAGGTFYLNYMLGLKARLTKDGYPAFGATINVQDWGAMLRYFRWDLEMSHDDIRFSGSKNRGFLISSRVTARVGPTREEKLGLARYIRLKLEPERDYKRAMELYLARDFLGAAYAFGKVITKYPAYHLVDQAAFFKGKSFENMRMHKAARQTYLEAARAYPFSEQQGNYKYRMMNIDYKEGKFSEAMVKHSEILSKYSESDVKSDADYVAGQIAFAQGKYQEAIALLSPILPGNANYVYARYTVGISWSRLQDMDKAELAFKDIIDYMPANKSEADMQAAAKVKLGHLYFSATPTPRVAEAATLYKSVTRESPVYDEAMLGIAWSFLKVQKPGQALKVADAIIGSLPNSYMIPESHLVRGYAYYLQKDWAKAKDALEKCRSLVGLPLVSTAAKDSAKSAYGDQINSFEGIQEKAMFLSRQLPTPRVNRKRASLKPDFVEAIQEIEDYATFMRRAQESDQYEQNRLRILSDAKYTLAIIEGKLGGSTNSAPAETFDDDDL
jgi:TolA-binding protein